MVRDTRKSKPFRIWILPDVSRPLWQIIIKKSNGTEYDLTDYCYNGRITRYEKAGLGRFNIKIINDNRKWNNKFDEGDEFIFYATYDAALVYSSHEIFRGKVDNAWLGREDIPFCELEGRDYPSIADDKTRIFRFDAANVLNTFVKLDDSTGSADDQGNFIDSLLHDTGLILQVYDERTSAWVLPKDLSAGDWTSLKSSFDYNVVRQFQNKNVISCAKTLMTVDGADLGWYVHHDAADDLWYFRIFKRGEIENITNICTYQNLLTGPNRVGRDNSSELNKVSVYGNSNDNTTLLLKTEEDTDSQSSSWIKAKAIQDKDLATMPQVQSYANDELLKNKVAPLIANGMSVIGLIDLLPGEKLPVNLPNEDINDSMIVASFTHTFGDNGFDTTPNFEEDEFSLAMEFKKRIDEEEALKTYVNINDMKNSLFFDFDDTNDEDEADYYTLSNLVVTNKILQLTTGQDTGTFTTKSTSSFTYAEMDDDVEQIELRFELGSLSDLDNLVFEVSNNDGTSYDTLTDPTIVHTFSTVGKRVRIRISFTRYVLQSPRISVLTVLIK